MTARDFDGSTDRLDWNSIQDAGGGVAQTFSCWGDFDSATAIRYFFAVNASGDASAVLLLRTVVATGRLQFSCTGAGNVNRSTADGTLTTGVHHILVTWDGTVNGTGIHIYVDGVEPSYVATNTGSSLNAATGLWSIGGRSFADSGNHDGRLWSFGWWDRVVSADEIAALAAGYHPSCFEYSLKFCPDMSSLYDPYSGLTGTADGTTTQDSLGPQILPCGPMVIVGQQAVTGSPWYYNLQQQLLAG